MDVRGWLRALVKYWWIVVGLTALALTGGAGTLALSENQYATSVTFFANTASDVAGSAVQGDQYGQRRINTYVQMVDSERLARMIVSDTGLDVTPAQVMSRITAKGDPNTVLLTATVVDTDPERSTLIAGSLANQLIALVSQLETPPGGTLPTVRLEIIGGPTLDPVPIEPRPLTVLGLGLAIGVILGVCLAVLRDALDTTIRSVDVLGATTGGSCLATIGYDAGAVGSPVIAEGRSFSPRAEAFRQLRTNLSFADVDRPVRVVIITSSVADEGKSSTATNLAVSYAHTGQRVLLVEGDLRRPRVADYLGLEGGVGLTNVLAGQAGIADVLQPWGRNGLTVLPSGSIPPNPAELLGSTQMAELVRALREMFDMVIVDTPPLLPVTDAAVAAAHADGVVVVVRYGRTRRHQLRQAVETLRAVDARLLGAVFNRTPVRGVDSYSYGYGYAEDVTSDRPRLDTSQVPEVPAGRHPDRVAG